ncbi:MAG: hypothetical protein JO128_22670, partial [Alphaproteobacteria bacterium]|nr:hypothetical protein [Alphaproteobacteria bacterium]
QRVMDLTPSEIPFSDRDPVARALLNHVPRVVWPDKPMENLGNVFGKRYGILNGDDDKTSWNVPWAVDFYMVYGFWGAILCMLPIGAVMAGCAGWISRRRDRAFWFGVFAAAEFPLFYQESNFSLMAGSVLWSAAGPIVGYWIAQRLVGAPAVQGPVLHKRSVSVKVRGGPNGAQPFDGAL